MNKKNQKFLDLLPLETERLIIKPSSTNDVDMLLKMDKQEITQKFLGGIKNKTKEERITFLERKTSKFKNGLAGQLTVYLKATNTTIGFTGLSIKEENNNASIGYIYDYDYCNKGYCTEACKKLIEIAFNILKLDNVYAETVEGNNSSKRVLEKLGFQFQNITKKDSVNFLNYILYRQSNKKD